MASSRFPHTGVIRQGDVLIIPWKKLSVKDSVKLNSLTLAKGEVTGHSHRISEGKAELYQRHGTLFLRVLSPTAKLQHEEHHPLNIPKGDWMVRIQREYRPIAPLVQTSEIINNPIQDSFTSKTTLSQKDTVVDFTTVTDKDSDNSLETPQDSWQSELLELANQVNSQYWNDLVEKAERKKEYLGKIMRNKNNEKFDDQYEERREYEKIIKGKNGMRDTEAKRESSDNGKIPSSRRQSRNWISGVFNNGNNQQPRNWINVTD